MSKRIQHNILVFNYFILLLFFSVYSTFAKPFSQPEVINLYPGLGSESVYPSVNLELVFNQAVKKGTGNIFIKDYVDDTVYYQFNINSSPVTISGSKVTIDLPSNLPLGKKIYVKIDPGSLKSINEEPFTGITDPGTWNFVTASYVIEHLSFSPALGTQCVSLNPTLELELTEPVNIGNGLIKIVRKDNFMIHEQFIASSGQVTGNASKHITIKLNKPLAPLTTYYVLIERTAFYNTTGAYAGIFDDNIWYFTSQLPPPSTSVSGTSCGQGQFSISASQYQVGTGGYAKHRWYETIDGLPIRNNNGEIWESDIFKTPILENDKTYFVSFFNGECESQRIPVSLTINPLPQINIVQSVSIYPGENTELSASAGNNCTYLWEPSEGLSNNTISNPTASPEQTITYTVTVTTDSGCSNQAQVTVEVKANETPVFLPNLFSPNGDGKNDNFRVLAKDNSVIASLDFRIYDRSGTILYQTQNVQEAITNGWDGRINGVLQPTDTYVWFLSGTYKNGKIITFDNKNTGSFVLMR